MDKYSPTEDPRDSTDGYVHPMDDDRRDFVTGLAVLLLLAVSVAAGAALALIAISGL